MGRGYGLLFLFQNISLLAKWPRPPNWVLCPWPSFHLSPPPSYFPTSRTSPWSISESWAGQLFEWEHKLSSSMNCVLYIGVILPHCCSRVGGHIIWALSDFFFDTCTITIPGVQSPFSSMWLCHLKVYSLKPSLADSWLNPEAGCRPPWSTE